MNCPLTDAVGLDNLDDTHLVYARRDFDSGRLQLVSLQKAIKLRISDYVSEYDFPEYRYPPGFQTTLTGRPSSPAATACDCSAT